MTEQQIEALRQECEKAKAKDDRDAYIEARRAYLLAQAELYQQRKAAGK